MKIKKWLDTPNLGQYEEFVCQWHYFLKDVQRMLEQVQSEAMVKKVAVYLLEEFYRKPYESETGFYEEFSRRLKEAKKQTGFA